MGKRDPCTSSFTVRGAGLLFIHKRDRADLQRGQRPAEIGGIIGFHRSPRQWELARGHRGVGPHRSHRQWESVRRGRGQRSLHTSIPRGGIPCSQLCQPLLRPRLITTTVATRMERRRGITRRSRTRPASEGDPVRTVVRPMDHGGDVLKLLLQRPLQGSR